MHGEYTALLKQEGDWWIGWIEEVPGLTVHERAPRRAAERLRETLKEALEFNRQDALREAGSSYYEVKLAVYKRRDLLAPWTKRVTLNAAGT